MKGFCFWENRFTSLRTCERRKMLLVKDDKDELIGEYNLTLLGIDKEVNSLEDFLKLFPQPFYQYKEDGE